MAVGNWHSTTVMKLDCLLGNKHASSKGHTVLADDVGCIVILEAIDGPRTHLGEQDRIESLKFELAIFADIGGAGDFFSRKERFVSGTVLVAQWHVENKLAVMLTSRPSKSMSDTRLSSSSGRLPSLLFFRKDLEVDLVFFCTPTWLLFSLNIVFHNAIRPLCSSI